ncbi:MAG: penicillin-binding protein activator LpoB [Deltaproteobacteria bacterium]|nr:penicillin-binding protein activator LpoB [Deltaproteobacteria bacterium]
MNLHSSIVRKVSPFFFAAALTACSQSPQVSRVDPNTTTDLTGAWNDTDSREVAQASIDDAMTFPWIDEFKQAKGRKPVVIAYGVKNKTREHINTETFIKDLERAFIRSGKVTVVASQEEREEIRGERADQQSGLTETPAEFGKEKGADFVLTGVLMDIYQREGGKEVVFYQANLQLINVTTNEKVWMGEKKIKKVVKRNRVGL